MPMVGVCDLLGFSNLVLSGDLTEIVKNHLGYLRKVLYHSIHQYDFPEEPPSLSELLDQDRVGFAWFSDTIFLYGQDDSEESNRHVIETIGWLISEAMLVPQVRIRAGVSFGPMYIDSENGIFVGPALVEAYRLEKKQLWSGGALSSSASENISPRDPWLIEYDVPIRGEYGERTTMRTLAINWTSIIHFPNTFLLDWLIDQPEPSQEEIDRNPDIVEKWRNTRQFHIDVCSSCNLQRV